MALNDSKKFIISVPASIFFCATSLLAGIGGTALYFNPPTVHEAAQHDDWIKLSVDSGDKAISYSSDALAKSDIKLPSVNSFSGKSKFVMETAAGEKPTVKLGYVINVDIAPLVASGIPDKYKSVATDNPGDKKTQINAVDYDVVFYFILKDKDGFPLMKVSSNRETVHSGINNHFQLFAKTYIPQTVVSSTKIINVRMEAVKCLTCKYEEEPGETRHKKRSLFNF